MKLYHVATEKLAKRYRETRSITPPVRGFDSLMAAMLWAMQTGRRVIYSFEVDKPWLLPDHHNKFSKAWWTDERIKYADIQCEVSATKGHGID